MKKNKKQFIITSAIAIIIALVVSVAFANDFLPNVENMLEDRAYQKADTIPSDIKIIAIDEETLSRLGPYSEWDRSCFAKLIEILNENEETAPKVIGMDIVFSGSNGEEDDVLLVEAAKKKDNLVLASSIVIDSYTYEDSDGKYHKAQYISGEGRPYDELAAVAEYGFTNMIFDDDGFIRRAYTSLTSKYEGETQVYDSFAYKILLKLGEVRNYKSQVDISYVGKPGDFEIISMADVLDGKSPASYFKDSIVLVGAYEEGLMDSYRVPIDYSKEMYGVELQANILCTFLNDRIIYDIDGMLQFLINIVVVAIYAYLALNIRTRNATIGLFGVILGYILAIFVVFQTTLCQMQILAVPMGVVLSYIISLIYKYTKMQKMRMSEMQGMLFSMAEAMAEAIEGRTPYNANHTKNVAKRCLEMMDFINEKHRKKKTDLHFSKEDKKQLYLAAMLHDVGKMDVPLEVMDKATKLGGKERVLIDRLEIIRLNIENDALSGRITRKEADELIEKINIFTESLGAFNCGRPLKDEEWAIINDIGERVYIDKAGKKIPYITEEEIDDLHIKAGTLSDKERKIMQSHVVYTDKILSHMQFGEQFKDVRAMAANHHECLNGKGYPKGIREEEIDTMTRILTIMDIYDSLIADDRPYKKPKTVKVAFDILDEEAKAGKIDKELLKFAKELYLEETGEK